MHQHIANLLIQGHHQGWLVYQFELHHRFGGLKHTLWVKDHYRMSCTGFHRILSTSPFKRLAHITCNIREVKGYIYPAA